MSGTYYGADTGLEARDINIIPLAEWQSGKLRQVDHLRSGVQDQPGQHGKILVSTKNTKIRQAWWWVPIIPPTQEAEVGESLESGRLKLQ